MNATKDESMKKRLILLFVITSVFGWLIDTLYRTFEAGYFVRGGFSRFPFSPIYGFGALIILYLHDFMRTHSLFLRFFVYMSVLTLYEYISGVLIMYISGQRLWDYSSSLIQFQGHIELVTALQWGLLALVFEHFYFAMSKIK